MTSKLVVVVVVTAVFLVTLSVPSHALDKCKLGPGGVKAAGSDRLVGPRHNGWRSYCSKESKSCQLTAIQQRPNVRPGVITPLTPTRRPTTLAPSTALPSLFTIPGNNTYVVKSGGKHGWSSPDLILCPSLLRSAPGVIIKCTSGVGESDCSKPQSVGTVAKYSCKKYYEATAEREVLYKRCKDDGTWNGHGEFNCIVTCGVSNEIAKTPFATGGKSAVKGQWPWNVAILTNALAGRKWTFICGGTLIQNNVVLTAAHCVTLPGSSEASYRFEFGKYERETRDETVQARQAAKINVHEAYNSYTFDSDIAIIFLESPVNIGPWVRPICYPRTSGTSLEDYHLSEGSLGTIVGWGKTESDELAETLREIQLPVVSTRKCIENTIESLSVKLQTRSTTYCAGFGNGTNVCEGDSGSGMYFPNIGTTSIRWYIQGLVSFGVTKAHKCIPTKFAFFTRVGKYADWIEKALVSYESR